MNRLLAGCTLALALIAPQVAAVPLLTPQDAPELYFGRHSGADNQELKNVVDALAKGDRQTAKERLGAYIKRFPNDARAVEIAGMILLEEKNLPAAALSFQRAAQLNPANASTRAKLGVTTLMMDRLAEGERMLRDVIRIDPNEMLAHRYLAWLAEERGDAATAAQHLEAMMTAPGFAAHKPSEIHVALARNYNQSGRPADTVRLLSPLVSPGAGLDAVPASLLLAQAHADLHKPAAASKALELAQKHLKAGDPQLLLGSASIDLARHAYAPARQKLEKAIELQPAVERIARERIAASYMDEGKPDLAADQFVRIAGIVAPAALPGVMSNYLTAKFTAKKGREAAATVGSWATKHPDQPGLGLLHIDALSAAGDRDAALAAARKLVAAQPDFIPAYISLGNLLRGLGKPEEASKQLRHATTVDPKMAELWVALAGVQADTGAWEKAEAVLQEGLKANPEQPMLQAELATTLELTGRRAEAVALYRSLVARYPDNVPLLARAALSIAATGQALDEARKLAESAVKLSNGHAVAKDALGWVLVESGDTKNGLPMLQTAYEAQPSDPQFTYHLGAALIKAGRKDEGRQLLERAKSMGGLRPDLQQSLAQLLG